jgi:Tfp pilus assembly protein PilO
MKASSSSTRTIVAIFVVVGLAVAFWVLLLGPKRDEADELGTQVEGLQATLAQAQSSVTVGEEARDQFSKNYKQLVVLGQAVPAGDETASLLVELNEVADKSDVSFNSIKLSSSAGSEGSEGEAAPAESTEPTTEGATGTPAASVVPTEAAASLRPLGAAVGPAGLSVMPSELTFSGGFFDIADFLKGMDSLVDTSKPEVGVDGRLVTIDGFSLVPAGEAGSSALNANFSVTTYLVPPGQGLTAGATSTAPAETTEPTEGAESTEVSEAR